MSRHSSSAAASSPVAPVQADLPAQAAPCWNRIGVYGDHSCPDLSRFVHCRNCPVYSNAALQLLERPLPPEYRQHWTEWFAIEKKVREAPALSAVIFRVGHEWLALPTRALLEVAERRAIHSLPHRRGLVLGLANVRGELLVCVSLAHLLGLPRTGSAQKSRSGEGRLLVACWDGNRLGFPVDQVQGPQRFYPEELKPLPTPVARPNPTFTHAIAQWQEHTVGVLDPDQLFATLNGGLS